jgi:hypothetical protein
MKVEKLLNTKSGQKASGSMLISCEELTGFVKAYFGY